MKAVRDVCNADKAAIRRNRGLAPRLALTLLAPVWASMAHAFEFDMGPDSDLRIRWDNTPKYTAAWRLKNPDLAVANQNGNQPNVDFGDLSFDKGMINNRLDLLSEFDLKYKNFGFRVSGAAWYDYEYNKNQNDFPNQVPNNQAAVMGGANNRFPRDTKTIMGQKSEFLDAFVYGKFELGERDLTLRAGKHTLLYGESLFLGNNAIAAAQGPVDVIKAMSLPNAQFKEIARPVGQVSGNFAVAQNVSIGGYYQYQWLENRLPAAGSYFSPADFVGSGGDLLLHPLGVLSPLFGGPLTPLGFMATRSDDLKGSDKGQWGAQLKFKIGDIDYGLYAARYDDKSPIAVLNAPSVAAGGGKFGGGTYNLMYAKDIKVYGGSLSTVVGETNVAAEISTRRNVPLVVPGDLIINSNFANPNADNQDNTPYARGNSLHLNLSSISLFGGNGFWGGASLIGELGFNRLLRITNRPTFTPGFPDPVSTRTTRDASAIRVVFQPEFFQVMPGVDLQVPIGLGYGLYGRSAVVQLSPEHGGDFTLGMNATIDRKWKAGLNYTHYFGDGNTVVSSATGPQSTYASYQQYYRDRDFISFTIQATF